MAKDLPGFYYDEEKNRYFPIKSRMPGSSRGNSSSSSSSSASAQNPVQKSSQTTSLCGRAGARTNKLLRSRELSGISISYKKRRCDFEHEFQKILLSQPTIWKYQGGTDGKADCGLEHIRVDVETADGQIETDVLLTGSKNGSLCFLGVGKEHEFSNHGVKYVPDCVWPPIKENHVHSLKIPGDMRRLALTILPSHLSCIKLSGRHGTVDGSDIQHALITTLGSQSSHGSVYMIDLVKPFDFTSRPFWGRQHVVSSFHGTIWTCDSSGRQLIIGTNKGVALVDLETGVTSSVCHSRSDILALQFVQSGNVALCGLRNGAIVTADLRQKPQSQERPFAKWFRVPFSDLGRTNQNFRKKWFEIKGPVVRSHTLCMPSSISCLVPLKSYDQYFLASSMDGSIKLYDHRRIQKECVQSYEGHVNSHTRIQLGVDPSERFIMSGGEDRNLRVWSIKSGELLFQNKFSNDVLSTVCWRRAERFKEVLDETHSSSEYLYEQNHRSDAWVGSLDGLYRVTLP